MEVCVEEWARSGDKLMRRAQHQASLLASQNLRPSFHDNSSASLSLLRLFLVCLRSSSFSPTTTAVSQVLLSFSPLPPSSSDDGSDEAYVRSLHSTTSSSRTISVPRPRLTPLDSPGLGVATFALGSWRMESGAVSGLEETWAGSKIQSLRMLSKTCWRVDLTRSLVGWLGFGSFGRLGGVGWRVMGDDVGELSEVFLQLLVVFLWNMVS